MRHSGGFKLVVDSLSMFGTTGDRTGNHAETTGTPSNMLSDGGVVIHQRNQRSNSFIYKYLFN
jgi:hypothetical protein